MASAERTETFDVTPEQVYAVLTDFATYPDFMDGVSSVEVLEESGNSWKVQFNINIIKQFSYVLKLKGEPNKNLTWTFDSGDLFKSSEGSWTLEDNGDGTTDVTYQIDADFKMMVPGMVTKKLIAGSLPSLMKSVQDQAKER